MAAVATIFKSDLKIVAMLLMRLIFIVFFSVQLSMRRVIRQQTNGADGGEQEEQVTVADMGDGDAEQVGASADA